jgi:hypothetical protein
MLKHIVIRLEFDVFTNLFGILLRVAYQSCAECYNNRARQNSAFLHKKRANYDVFGECRSSAKTAKQLPANCLLRACETKIRREVEMPTLKHMRCRIY